MPLAPSRSVAPNAPSRAATPGRGARVITPIDTQFFEQHSIALSGSSLHSAANPLWTLGDIYTFAFWVKFVGTQTSDPCTYFDLRSTVNNLSRVSISKDLAGTKVRLFCTDWLGVTKVNALHTTTIASIQDAWTRVVVWKFKNVLSRLYINGSYLHAAGNYLTIDGSRSLYINDNVETTADAGSIRIGHMYFWNGSVSGAVLDGVMASEKHGWNPNFPTGSYTQANADVLVRWYRPGEYGLVGDDKVGSNDFTGAGGASISSRVEDGP